MDKLLYGDFEEQYTDYETAEIAILPVPYDGTSTWLKGADKGPRAILEASPNMEFYDIETDSEVYKHGIATLEPVTADSSPQAMAQEVEQRVEAILKDKKFPVLLGGEHSVSIGAFKAIAKYYDTFSILQLVLIRICGTNTKVRLTISLCYGPGQRNYPKCRSGRYS